MRCLQLGVGARTRATSEETAMTILDDDEAAIKALNLDRLPTHIIDKRVTELMDLTGKKAFVTGAGGDGLGHAIANRLAGWVLTSRWSAGRWNHLSAGPRRSRHAGTSTPCRCKPTCRTGIRSTTQSAKPTRQLGGLDIMINNPVMVAAGPFEKQTKDEIDLTVLGSLTMMMYGAHAALEYLLPQGSGVIINIGSVGGRVQQRGLVAYNACKSGVIGFTRNLAHEVAPRGVNVFCVAPGIMIKEQMQQYLFDPQTDQHRTAVTRSSSRSPIRCSWPCLPARGGCQYGRLPGLRSRELHVWPDDRRGRRPVDGLNMPSPMKFRMRPSLQTGLEDFGDDSYREGLEILLAVAAGRGAAQHPRRGVHLSSASSAIWLSDCRSRTGTADIPRSTTSASTRR